MPATSVTAKTTPVPSSAAAVGGLARYVSFGIVCAHPDDESFGLGAVIAALVDGGARASLACLTRGEGSTLGANADLSELRTRELGQAAEVLGITTVEAFDHPDGRLAEVDFARLVADVCGAVADGEALLTFDHGGITGHPDHQRATDAAVAAGRQLGVPVFGWALPEDVAGTLRHEFGAPFVGRPSDDLHHRIEVDRAQQRRAMACHTSQDNPVPHRRIELQGPEEHLRVLHRPGAAAADGTTFEEHEATRSTEQR